MGRRVRFETPSSNRNIGQWWTQEAKPVLTRTYGKFTSLVSKETLRHKESNDWAI
jgi:hypothetical protein